MKTNMFKKLLSLLLCVAICMAFMPTFVLAETPERYNVSVISNATDKGSVALEVDGQKWWGSSASSLWQADSTIIAYARAENGCAFLGWRNETGRIVSQSTEYSVKVTGEIRLYADFVSSDCVVGQGWWLDADGCLHMFGAITNNSDETDTPWYEAMGTHKRIRSVIAEEGSSINNCYWLFHDATNLVTADIRKLDTSGVTNMAGMFIACKNLVECNAAGIDTSAVTDMYSMFYGCSSLEKVDVSGFVFTTSGDIAGMFDGCSSLNEIDLSSWSFPKFGYPIIARMFQNCTNLAYIDMSGLQIKASGKETADVVAGCDSLVMIRAHESFYDRCAAMVWRVAKEWTNKNTGEVYTDYQQAFETSGPDVVLARPFSGDGWNLDINQKLHLTGAVTNPTVVGGKDLTPWEPFKGLITSVEAQNGASVDNGNSLFENCSILSSADLGKLNTTGVLRMANMFASCPVLSNVNLGKMNTASVTNTHRMFADCGMLETLDLRSLNTSAVYDMGGMFENCRSLTNLDLSSFDTTRTAYMNEMFAGCENLTALHLSNFSTGRATRMNGMFKDCKNLRFLDISSFTTGSLEDTQTGSADDFFDGCTSLETVGVNYDIIRPIVTSLATVSYTWLDTETDTERVGVSQMRDIAGKTFLVKSGTSFHHLWVGDIPVTDGNMNDILGDGCARFVPSSGMLYLEDLTITDRWHENANGRKAMLSIDCYLTVCLEGENTLKNIGWTDRDGVYIAEEYSVNFIGDGCLNVAVSKNGGRAICAENNAVSTNDNVTLNLSGHYGYYDNYTGGDRGSLTLYDRSRVYAFGYRADDDAEGLAILCPDITVCDNARLYAEYDWNQPAVDTFDSGFAYLSPLTVRGIRNIAGMVNQQWTGLTGINGSFDAQEEDFRALDIQAGNVLPGDVNLDGRVDAQDVTYLKQMLLKNSTDLKYDLNGDKSVDIRDLVALKKILA
ncbi:MAG: BspA family leucine-rich repeat surface protein [Clostridia bacterium]|nr:BspA family leucine-rich repeat surface protein [Clostridia bacterium]